MGGPKFTAQGPGPRKGGRASAAMKPKQQPKRSGKPTNSKVDVENLELHASPIEKRMVTPRSARRSSGSSFLQPDQFIAELKVKTDRSELVVNDSPGSARSTSSVRSSGWEPSSPHLRKSPKARLGAAEREPMLRSGLESLCEPASSVPTLELAYDGKPAPAPAHLRVRTTSSQPAPELQKSSSERSGRFFKRASPALLKLSATSGLLAESCSPATMREKLVRSVSEKEEGTSDSRAVHSFHAGMSQTVKASQEGEKSSDVKPAGRLRRMLHWGASKTGLEVLKSLERKLGKKSSKVSSKSGEPRIDVEREIREVTAKTESEAFDDGDWSPRSASSVSTTYSDVSSKSHSHKHSQHKKSAKAEAVKSKLWLLRVHQKRPSKGAPEEDTIYEAVRGATFHGVPDSTFKDVDKKPSPGSARFHLEKNAIAKLVAKHKRNSTWDAAKLSPSDHLFSPKQPRLPKSDAHILLAPPKKLISITGETDFQRRRGNPSLSNSNKSSSPRPEPQVATSPATSQIITLKSTSPQQGVALPAAPSPVPTPPVSPGTLSVSSRSSFQGFNSPLPLPVRVGPVGLPSSPPSPIYAASVSPRARGSSPKLQSTPTSPRLHAPSPGRAEVQSPISPGANADATSSLSPGSNSEEVFVLANSSFDSSSSSNSPVSAAKPPGPSRAWLRSASVVRRNVPKREPEERQTGSDIAILALPAPLRPPAVPFEQIVAGHGQTPPTDNTLMKFFFKCREIEHLNKFLALQKKRFLESLSTNSEKCFHMILSEAGKGLSSMISTLCTAWLLENTMASPSVKWHPIPVLNISQKDMWQHRDAAWLFHVCGIEADAVLFLDEITSSNETVVPGRVKRAVAGQDILITKDEVASSCTIVSEKFRQEAPKLLQARYMKTLLLAGILVDTRNLSTGSSRDKQQATVLLVGAGSLGRNGFYKHLVNIRDENYVTTFIKETYGDSNALTGEKLVPRRTQGIERPKSLSASSHMDERSPTSRPAPLRPPPLTIPNSPSEAPASILPVPSRKPITILTHKSEVETKPSQKSEVEAKLSRKPKVEAKPSRKPEVDVKLTHKSASADGKKDGASKVSFGLRFRNRSSQ